MHRTRWRRGIWNCWGKTLALCAAIVCFTHPHAAHAQCEGGAAAATGGAAATTVGGVALQGAQFDALQQMALQAQMQAQMQARMQALVAQQQAAAQRRARLLEQRGESAAERRSGFERIAECSTGMGCDFAVQNRSGRAVRDTFAEQAARTTGHERLVARLLEREAERQSELRQRIAERDAEMDLRRLRALAQR